MSALLFAVGLTVAAHGPSCDGKVLVLHSTYGECLAPAEATAIAGGAVRFELGDDGQAVIIWPSLW